jgi:exodeoxyribonuclease-3
MKLLSWNIQHGGGKRIERIASAIHEHEPDIIVLTEFRNNESGKTLCKLLSKDGFEHSQSSIPTGQPNGVCVFSCSCIHPEPRMEPEVAGRWIDAEMPDKAFGFSALYVPGVNPHDRVQSLKRKTEFWDAILAQAKKRRQSKHLFIGDFNTGIHYKDEARATFSCADKFEGLGGSDSGWVDAWRKRKAANAPNEYTWYSKLKGGLPGHGYRLDHAFVTETVKVGDCKYSHEERERNPRLSDHSILILDLEV